MGTFAAELDAANVSGQYTFHPWRHTFCTRLNAASVSDEIAKGWGGWTRDVTAMRYDHDGRAADLRDAVEWAAGR